MIDQVYEVHSSGGNHSAIKIFWYDGSNLTSISSDSDDESDNTNVPIRLRTVKISTKFCSFGETDPRNQHKLIRSEEKEFHYLLCNCT